MNKEEIEKKMEEIKENYEKINEQIEKLKNNKLRLEGQYSVYQDMMNNNKESEEIGD